MRACGEVRAPVRGGTRARRGARACGKECARVRARGARARVERWARREGGLLRSASEFPSGGVGDASERGLSGARACLRCERELGRGRGASGEDRGEGGGRWTRALATWKTSGWELGRCGCRRCGRRGLSEPGAEKVSRRAAGLREGRTCSEVETSGEMERLGYWGVKSSNAVVRREGGPS